MVIAFVILNEAGSSVGQVGMYTEFHVRLNTMLVILCICACMCCLQPLVLDAH